MPNGARILAAVEFEPGAAILRLDDGETLEIAPDALPPGLPAVGGSLTEPQLAALRAAAARKQVARRLLAMLDRRLDSRARLRDKLCAQGFAAAAVDDVLDQAAAQGLHSDRLVAAAYCRDTLRGRAVGRRWLQARLGALGVPADLAAAVAAQELPPERERELAAAAAAARWRRERGRDLRALARVQRFLASRGFAPQLAAEAARRQQPGGAGED